MNQNMLNYIKNILELIKRHQLEQTDSDSFDDKFRQDFAMLHQQLFEQSDQNFPQNKFFQLAYCLSQIYANQKRFQEHVQDFPEEQFFLDFNSYYKKNEDKFYGAKNQNSLLSLDSLQEKIELNLNYEFMGSSASLINKFILSDKLLFSLKVIIKCIQESFNKDRTFFDNQIVEMEELLNKFPVLAQQIQDRVQSVKELEKFDQILEQFLKTGRIGELLQTLKTFKLEKQFKFFNEQIPLLCEQINDVILCDSYYDEDTIHLAKVSKNLTIGNCDWIQNRFRYKKKQNLVSQYCYQLLNSQLTNTEDDLINLQQILQQFLQQQIYKRYILFRKKYPESFSKFQEDPNIQQLFTRLDCQEILTKLFLVESSDIQLQQNFFGFLHQFESSQKNKLLKNLSLFFNNQTAINYDHINELNHENLFIAFVNTFREQKDQKFLSKFQTFLFNKFEYREMFYYIVGRNEYFDPNFIADFICNNMNKMQNSNDESMLMKQYLSQDQQHEVQQALAQKQNLNDNRLINETSNNNLETNLQNLTHWIDESQQVKIVFQRFFQCLLHRKYKDAKFVFQRHIIQYHLQEANFFQIKELINIIYQALIALDQLDKTIQGQKEKIKQQQNFQQKIFQEEIEKIQISIEVVEYCIQYLKENIEFNKQLLQKNQNIIQNEDDINIITQTLIQYLVDRVMNFFKFISLIEGFSDMFFNFVNSLCCQDIILDNNLLMDVTKEMIIGDHELLPLFINKIQPFIQKNFF